jgi:hypothetical protein
MYTKEYDEEADGWHIYDPCGDSIVFVTSTIQANVLLSHLNRG